MKKVKFDEALEKLEAITSALESGEVGLEEAMKMYEKGMELALNCQRILAETESRIQLLTEEGNGKLTLQPIRLEASEDASKERQE